jgi:hypothetical protein
MTKAEKPMCGTEISVNHIFKEFLQYTDKLDHFNVLNILVKALEPDAHATNPVLMFLINI